MKPTPVPRPARRRQRGISLFVVLVMVLLTALMTLWAARTALFNELVTGNDSDYQRALEAAHAMVRDAELDILGIRPDGQPCTATVGFLNCRPAAVQSNMVLATKKVYFPPSRDKGGNGSDLVLLTSMLVTAPIATPSCVAAICVQGPNLAPQFWLTPTGATGLDAMRKVGARYGEYTGANATVAGNPLLQWAPTVLATPAFYWVEPLHYESQGLLSKASQDYAPTAGIASASAVGVVYRITAVVRGLKPGTQAVVQTVFVRKETGGG